MRQRAGTGWVRRRAGRVLCDGLANGTAAEGRRLNVGSERQARRVHSGRWLSSCAVDGLQQSRGSSGAEQDAASLRCTSRRLLVSVRPDAKRSRSILCVERTTSDRGRRGHGGMKGWGWQCAQAIMHDVVDCVIDVMGE